jgi:hypothetical protein
MWLRSAVLKAMNVSGGEYPGLLPVRAAGYLCLILKEPTITFTKTQPTRINSDSRQSPVIDFMIISCRVNLISGILAS